ncbi:hypothetical protein [Moheibacter sediminis]|uniref:Uncharacterized protein n=1 Tax=Moheibacter sediminis TaxID=1434700 RepID=A0A1W2BUQ7_9FLAO|nr:hypothetical protein [Moheibacter sediminis]SMC76687.1 hypothetical protein SAMN06296427_107163 [Moheibacter sediminis]
MIVLFVFGFMFYKLAMGYDKNPWIWALVGAGSYIVIQLLINILVGFLSALNMIPEISGITLTIITVGVSSGSVYLGYRYLKNKWDEEDTRFDLHGRDEINNIGKD